MYTNRWNGGIVCFVFDLSIVIQLYIISLFSVTVLHNTFYIHVFYSVNFKLGIEDRASCHEHYESRFLKVWKSLKFVLETIHIDWLHKGQEDPELQKIYQLSTGITKLWKLRRQEFIRGWSQMKSRNSIFLCSTRLVVFAFYAILYPQRLRELKKRSWIVVVKSYALKELG